MALMRTSGVLPMVSRMLSQMPLEGARTSRGDASSLGAGARYVGRWTTGSEPGVTKARRAEVSIRPPRHRARATNRPYFPSLSLSRSSSVKTSLIASPVFSAPPLVVSAPFLAPSRSPLRRAWRASAVAFGDLLRVRGDVDIDVARPTWRRSRLTRSWSITSVTPSVLRAIVTRRAPLRRRLDVAAQRHDLVLRVNVDLVRLDRVVGRHLRLDRRGDARIRLSAGDGERSPAAETHVKTSS